MSGLNWQWKVRLRFLALAFILGSGFLLTTFLIIFHQKHKAMSLAEKNLELAFLIPNEEELGDYSEDYFQTHPELVSLMVFNRNQEKVYEQARDLCFEKNATKRDWHLKSCQRLGNAFGLELKVDTAQGRRMVLAVWEPRALPPSGGWLVVIIAGIISAGGIGLGLIFAYQVYLPVGKLAVKIKYIEPGLFNNLKPEPDWIYSLNQDLGIIRKELQARSEHIVKVQGIFKKWRQVQAQKLKDRIDFLDRALKSTQLQLFRLVEELKGPIRHIAQNTRLLYNQASTQLPVEMEGKFLILLRETERVRDVLIEFEEALELKKHQDEEAEMVNLNELLTSLQSEMSQLLDSYHAQIKFKNPLPTIYCHRARMSELLKGLIEFLLRQEPERVNPSIEIGYTNLEDRLFFTLSITGEKKLKAEPLVDADDLMPERPPLELKPALRIIVEGYGGDLWKGEDEEKNGVIFFTLPKSSLRSEPKLQAVA